MAKETRAGLKVKMSAIAFAVATTFTAPAANAEHALTTSGYWTAYENRSSNNKQLCGVRTYLKPADKSFTARFEMKFEPGGQIFLHLVKSTWEFHGAEIPVDATLTFDSVEFNMTGKASVFEHTNERYVQWARLENGYGITVICPPGGFMDSHTKPYAVRNVLAINEDGYMVMKDQDAPFPGEC